MSDVSEHSEFCYPERKKKGKARWSYDKMLKHPKVMRHSPFKLSGFHHSAHDLDRNFQQIPNFK